MQIKSIHRSELDRSVNFWFDNDLEARYVRRDDDKILVYVSSQQGCRQACRFCHLTQTGQTSDQNASFRELTEQFNWVLRAEYASDLNNGHIPAKTLHINFMARGEPLMNPSVFDPRWPAYLKLQAPEFTGRTRMNISTIVPRDMPEHDIAQELPIHWFYSLYSLNSDFRRRWLPKASDPVQAVRWLQTTGHPITIHHALIAGENDSLEDAYQIALFIAERFEQPPRFNLVRFNSPDPRYTEASQASIDAYLAILAPVVSRIRVVPRVGPDVMASCGTFLS